MLTRGKMIHINAPDFEQRRRETLPESFLNDPAKAYELLVDWSFGARDLGVHYSGDSLGALVLAWDMNIAKRPTDERPFSRLRLLRAGNYKPYETIPGDPRPPVRVCAEGNLLVTVTKEDDILLPFMFLRGPEKVKPTEGVRDTEGIHLCRPCRTRSLPLLGMDFPVISFRGDKREPIEAITTGRQVEYNDHEQEKIVIATGAAAIKEYIIEELLKPARVGEGLKVTKYNKPNGNYRLLAMSQRTQ